MWHSVSQTAQNSPTVMGYSNTSSVQYKKKESVKADIKFNVKSNNQAPKHESHP